MKYILLASLFYFQVYSFCQNIPFQSYSLGDGYEVVKQDKGIGKVKKYFEKEILVSLPEIHTLSFFTKSSIILFNVFNNNSKLWCAIYYASTGIEEKFNVFKSRLIEIYGCPSEDKTFIDENKLKAILVQWNFDSYMIWLAVERDEDSNFVLRLRTFTNKYLLSGQMNKIM